MTSHDEVSDALDQALGEAAILSVFQPIWTVDGKLLGFEALSRFHNGSPPDEVWALAHKRGVAARLDQVALRRAIEGSSDLPGRLFLNVTTAHLANPEALKTFGDPDRVVWEVSERTGIALTGLDGLRWLKNQDYTIAMDDAGVGHSTIERLEAIRPEIVKLDRRVVEVWASGRPEPLRQWVSAATKIGAMVLAEGVEDRRWVAALAQEGVTAVQGYGLGRPLPPDYWRTVPTATPITDGQR
ncbi:MAG: EAL domain-containing protein [Firmicutes bacterium]|nr:EAL domain-containing protein [Bacillota bacterium]